MLKRLLLGVAVASKTGLIIAGVAVLIGAINYLDAVHGDKIRKYLSSG